MSGRRMTAAKPPTPAAQTGPSPGEPAPRTGWASFSYLPPFALLFAIVALVVAHVNEHPTFTRFHAWQSFFFSLLATAVYAPLGVLLATSRPLFALLSIVITAYWLLVYVVLGIFAYKAYRGQWFRVWIVGGWARRLAGP